jgi:P4 family phage/plasmid primase-like protien
MSAEQNGPHMPEDAPDLPFAPPRHPLNHFALPLVEEGCRMWRGDESEISDLLLMHWFGEHMVYTSGQFWQYQPDRKGWHRLPREKAVTWAASMAGASIYAGAGKDDDIKTRPLSMSSAKASGAVTLAASKRHHDEQTGDYWSKGTVDHRQGVAQFRDKAVVVTQVRSGELKLSVEEPHPDHRIRSMRVLPCAWQGMPDPAALREDCPVLWGAAWDWWGHHEEDETWRRLNVILEFVGASVMGMAPSMGAALLLFGPGGTGKSTMLDLMTRWCRNGGVCSVTPQDMGVNRFASARLDGALMNAVDDLPSDAISDAGVWKSSITGGRIDVERKGKDAHGVYPNCGHFYAGNRFPVAKKANSGFWRRWVIVHYDRVFSDTDDDRDILPELLGEMEKIIAHAIAAFVATGGKGGKGYTKPHCHYEQMTEWKKISDSVADFASTMMVKALESTIKMLYPRRSEVYAEYKKWCGVNGRHAVSAAEMYRRLPDFGYKGAKISGIRRIECALLECDDG